MGITCSPLTYKYSNLPLPLIWGNFNGDFAQFYYKITLNGSQNITLYSHLG